MKLKNYCIQRLEFKSSQLITSYQKMRTMPKEEDQLAYFVQFIIVKSSKYLWRILPDRLINKLNISTTNQIQVKHRSIRMFVYLLSVPGVRADKYKKKTCNFQKQTEQR